MDEQREGGMERERREERVRETCREDRRRG